MNNSNEADETNHFAETEEIARRWQTIKKLFEAASGLTGKDRGKFLKKSCGDDAKLCKEVEKLLASFEDSRSFLENPAVAEVASLFEDKATLKGYQTTGEVKNGSFVAGTVLASRYRILGLIGTDEMGEVYKAEDIKFNQTVAIKFPPDKFQEDSEALERFISEVRNAWRVSNANVCGVFDIGEFEGRHFLSMELIERDVLFERPCHFGTVPIDDSFPKHLRQFNQKWRQLSQPQITDSESIRQDLLFAVPTLNRYEALVNLLESVDGGSIKPASYLVIDNGGKLKDEINNNDWKLPANTEVIEPGRNIGVAASWNLALARDFAYTVLAGDDCFFEQHALEMLLEAADKITEPSLFYPNFKNNSSEWACFLQTKSLTDLIGMYDERFYPAYFEDDDFRHRMSLFGLAPIFVPEAIVDHLGGATCRQFDQSSLWVNAQRYEEKWGGAKGAEKVLQAPAIFRKNANTSKNHLKIVVYTITKNEEKFIERYCQAAQEADEIVIVDTGSTDKTIEIAEKCGATVHRISIFPWRFDTARSAALALLRADADVCISVDADEVLEPGWRDEIEKVWTKGTTRLKCLFDVGSGIRFLADKVHARHGYFWKHPCHELLVSDGRISEKIAVTKKLIFRHLPDQDKSRGQYLDLLKFSVEEDPSCPRNSLYYARELTFYKKHIEAIAELKRYLSLPNATWDVERGYVMRLLGYAYEALTESDEALNWFIKATEISPKRRESWFALAQAYYHRSSWDECFATAVKCLSIPVSPDWLTDVRANGALPFDYAAISASWIGKNSEALEYGKKALNLEPHNSRLARNLEWYQKMMSEKKSKKLADFLNRATAARRLT